MAHDVFVSYATEDMRTVTSLVHFLEADGVRCWYAPRDVLPGANYGAQIADAIRSTHILILVLSSHSNRSTPVSNEVERAVHNGVVVIPIRIEDVIPSPNLELHIAGAHWLDALSETLESHQAALVRAVRKHLEAIGGEPARPPSSTRSQAQPGPHSARAASAPQAEAPAHSKPTNRTPLLVALASAMLIGAGAGVWFITRPTPPENSLAAGTVPESGTGIPTVAPAPPEQVADSAQATENEPSAEAPAVELARLEEATPEVVDGAPPPLAERRADAVPESPEPINDRTQGDGPSSNAPEAQPPGAELESEVATWTLVAGVRAEGAVGIKNESSRDEWTLTTSDDGYVRFHFTNRNPRDSREGVIESIEVSANAESPWQRPLGPSNSLWTNQIAVGVGQIVRVRVKAKDGHAAPYSIEPIFTPLGSPCPPDDTQGELEPGVATSGCVGFENGDSEDGWTYTPTGDGHVQFEFTNRNPRDTQQGVIELIEVSANAESPWKRPLGPGNTLRSDQFAVGSGQVVRVRVNARDGHAAPYGIEPTFTPLGTPCPPDTTQGELEPGVATSGCVGFENRDSEDEWTYRARADGYVRLQFTNNNPRGTQQGVIEWIEVSVGGESPWRRPLGPNDTLRTNQIAVGDGQAVRVRVRARDGHAAPYSIEPTFTPLGTPCPPDVTQGELEPGVATSGCVGFENGDSEDDWTYTASANGSVQFEFINRNPRDAELSVIEMVEISSNGRSLWKRPLGPNQTLSSNNLAVVDGQVVRVRVKARDGHAAPYSILLNFAP